MPLTAKGIYALGKDFLREAIARSTAFQTLCGVATAELARAQILIGETTALPARPFLVIEESDGNALGTRRVGVGAFQSSITLALTLFGTVASAAQSDQRQARLSADNDLGALHDLIQAAHGSVCADDGTVIEISDISRAFGPLYEPRAQAEDQGVPFVNWKAGLTVRLGPE